MQAVDGLTDLRLGFGTSRDNSARMNTPKTRRDFLKETALLAGALAAAGRPALAATPP